MRILIVDDNHSLVRGLVAFLEAERHRAVGAGTVAEGRACLTRGGFDLVITDLRLPDGDGLDIVRAAREGPEPAEVILMTAHGSVPTAVEAMKLGAADYLIKPVSPEEFAFRIDRLAKLRLGSRRAAAIERVHHDLLAAAGLAAPLAEIVGSAPSIAGLKATIAKVAPFPSTVLITGETGVGKELVARAIHAGSTRAGEPFVRVNCASIPDTLFESELFGHERGSFTDARERRIGRFEAADGGTLFLDEVGEVPLHLQAKLLRALQEKEITRVGGSDPIRVDVRIIAATNRDLEAMVAAGTFRSDLLYRLAVIRLVVPPLRDRRSDLPALARHLMARLAPELGRPHLRLSSAAIDLIADARWPGNVRELRNCLERAIVTADGEEITAADLHLAGEAAGASTPISTEAAMGAPAPVTPPGTTAGDGAAAQTGVVNRLPRPRATVELPPGGLVAALADFERELIVTALRQANGVKLRAAAALGIPRTNLLYRLKRLGLAGASEGDGDGEGLSAADPAPPGDGQIEDPAAGSGDTPG